MSMYVGDVEVEGVLLFPFAGEDRLIKRISQTGDMNYLCYSFSGSDFSFLEGLDTSYVKQMRNTFNNCSKAVIIPPLDGYSCGSYTNIIANCPLLESFYIKNLKVSINYIAPNLNINSLANQFQQCWINTGSNIKDITISAEAYEKIQNVYVRLIEATAEMKANDAYINNKAPFEMCNSTDEGAMLLEEYMTNKRWAISVSE